MLERGDIEEQSVWMRIRRSDSGLPGAGHGKAQLRGVQLGGECKGDRDAEDQEEGEGAAGNDQRGNRDSGDAY